MYSELEGYPIPQGTFRNIIITAIKLRKYEWVQKFIKEYVNKLAPEYRDDMYHFSYIYLYFMKGEFDKALDHITMVKYKYFFFKYDLRVLMLEIYYEMKYIDESSSLIDAFRHFILNDKTASQTFKELHSNFVRFLSKLIKIREQRNPAEIEDLCREINNTKLSVSKDWLLKKAAELLKQGGMAKAVPRSYNIVEEA